MTNFYLHKSRVASLCAHPCENLVVKMHGQNCSKLSSGSTTTLSRSSGSIHRGPCVLLFSPLSKFFLFHDRADNNRSATSGQGLSPDGYFPALGTWCAYSRCSVKVYRVETCLGSHPLTAVSSAETQSGPAVVYSAHSVLPADPNRELTGSGSKLSPGA